MQYTQQKARGQNRARRGRRGGLRLYAVQVGPEDPRIHRGRPGDAEESRDPGQCQADWQSQSHGGHTETAVRPALAASHGRRAGRKLPLRHGHD